MADLSSTDRRNARDTESSADDLASLHDKLDILWIRYLDLVDQYQSAQKDLQKQLSSGFFSLAQANFKSPNRRRYGQDFYDERMKASRLCHFYDDEDEAVKLTFSSVEAPASAKKAEQKTEGEKQPQQEPSPPATLAPEAEKPPPSSTDETTNEEGAKHETKDDETPKSPPDPIRWFGILVPQELRRAQASFASVLQEPGSDGNGGAVARAANAARAMRGLEIEIGRCRKAIRRRIEERVE